ncbi:class III lanthionine synthetase LanKC [Alkalicoccobacillus gibsonii]|uniref:class III lanthionine synthetase LanKC n=1 Tax=Alkalicoccobacillus gibsonii TaxID=79881 RepID=UPI003517F256
MDNRYLKYINNNYYYGLTSDSKQTLLTLPPVPAEYVLIDGDHWTNILVRNESIPKQGWKIHISTNIKDAQETLNIIFELMIERSISFKYVKSIMELMLKDSKYGDRGSSGKFITIYPKDTNQFIYLLKLLRNELKHLKPGPYILNDKRWYDSNIYFRYGAFIPRYLYKDGEKLDAIENEKGELIEDQRVPYYSLPDFVEEPEEIKKMDEEVDQLDTTSPLDNYEIEEAIHFSNGGGVYIAINKDNKKSILKEGRPYTAVDAQDQDAFNRIVNESEVLEKLRNTTYPVKKINSFKAWEHYFLEEEFIEGQSLSEWLVQKYPFGADKKNKVFVESCINIVNQLVEAIEELHENGIGMGDLQPANIIITPDEFVRLIDFETASDIDDTLSGLMTPGFIGDQDMNRRQSDWFAMLRITKQLFVPIGSVQDISWNMDTIHNQWVYDVYGSEALDLIKRIETICTYYQSRPMKELIETTGKLRKNFELTEMKKKLRGSIIKDLKNEDRLLPGDIRQYEMDSGLFNILTGGFGVAMALNRTGGVNSTVIDWVEKQELNRLLELENGLFTGKMGIATVLWELGYHDKSKNLYDSVIIQIEEINDISLVTGLSGIGLAALGFSYEVDDPQYLKDCLHIGELLKDKLDSDSPIVTFDYDVVNKGVMTSWAGVSLFFTAMYKKTKNKDWLTLSEIALEKDLKLGVFDDDGLYQVDDDFRILPYLAGGGAGLAIAITELESNTNEQKWNKELDGICKISNSKTFYNAGLFQGTTGILAISNLLELYTRNEGLVNSVLFTLNLHLMETDEYLFVPGDTCFRLSGDIMSGSSGLLLTVNDILTKNNYSWIPVLNLNEVLMTSCFKGGEIRDEGRISVTENAQESIR